MKSNNLTCFVGALTANIAPGVLTAPHDAASAKREALSIDIRPGGGAFHAAVEFDRLTDCDAVLLALVGQDEVGRLVVDSARQTLPHIEPVVAVPKTRATLVMPRPDDPSASLCWTVRPAIDVVRLTDELEPKLPQMDRLVLASLSADEIPLVALLRRQFSGLLYLLPTAAMCRERHAMLELLAGLNSTDVVQFNAHELAALTSCAEVEQGIRQLHAEGVSARLVVTCGRRGIVAYVGGQWHASPAYAVASRSDLGAGDTVAGAVLAGLHLERPWADIVRCASAAAALHVAGIERRGGWDELYEFARSAPRVALRPKSIEPVSAAGERPWLAPLGYAALTAAVGLGLLRLLGAA